MLFIVLVIDLLMLIVPVARMPFGVCGRLRRPHPATCSRATGFASEKGSAILPCSKANMADFNIRADSVDVQSVLEQIRARLREKRGVDYTCLLYTSPSP